MILIRVPNNDKGWNWPRPLKVKSRLGIHGIYFVICQSTYNGFIMIEIPKILLLGFIWWYFSVIFGGLVQAEDCGKEWTHGIELIKRQRSRIGLRIYGPNVDDVPLKSFIINFVFLSCLLFLCLSQAPYSQSSPTSTLFLSLCLCLALVTYSARSSVEADRRYQRLTTHP